MYREFSFSLVFLLLFCQLLNAQKGVRVRGKIKGLDVTMLYIKMEDASLDNGVRWDSISVVNNSFDSVLNFSTTQIATLIPEMKRLEKRTGNAFVPVKSAYLVFVAEPGASVYFKGDIKDFVDAYPSGTSSNNDLAKVNKAIFPLLNEIANKRLLLREIGEEDSIKTSLLQDTIDSIDKKLVTLKKDFIAKNTSSIASAYYLDDMVARSELTNEEAVKLFDNLNEKKLTGIKYYEDVKRRTTSILKTSEGMVVPPVVSSNTFDGENFDLTSLRGKFVVIDFWGTWCYPCIKGMPKMKEYLDKYKNSLEIVGIAEQPKFREEWMQWLRSNSQYNWHHLFNEQGPNNFVLTFNVQGYPTKFIIDPNGKIVGKFLGESEPFYEKLDELLMNK